MTANAYDILSTAFKARYEQWLCDGYSCDVRYVATTNGTSPVLYDAAVFLNPRPNSTDHRLIVRADPILAGQVQDDGLTKAQAVALADKALSGAISAGNLELTLPRNGDLMFFAESMSSSTWFQPLSGQVSGAPLGNVIADSSPLNAQLRTGTPPFDGIDDLCNWLGLRLPYSGNGCTIKLIVSPPIDLIVDRCGFFDDRLRLVLSAVRAADRSKVRLAVRAVPGDGLRGRVQLADKIEWREAADGLLEGTVEVALSDTNAALTMLSIGHDTTRRNWFLDPKKAPNLRFAAIHQFDSELHMIRQGLFKDTDSHRFETAVSALLFIVGFSTAVQLETDSPDLIVATPIGRLVLVECTTRVADVASKIGKLVDRRGELQKRLRAANQPAEVAAALVCRLPRDQIAAQAEQLRSMSILLATEEDLNDWLARSQLAPNADGILTDALHALTAPQSPHGVN